MVLKDKNNSSKKFYLRKNVKSKSELSKFKFYLNFLFILCYNLLNFKYTR